MAAFPALAYEPFCTQFSAGPQSGDSAQHHLTSPPHLAELTWPKGKASRP